MQSWIPLIVLFFLIILVIPQFFKIYFSYNPLTNFGVVVIKFWFIKIVFFSFEFKHTGIILRTKKSRKQMEYQFSDPKLQSYEYFMNRVKDAMYVHKLDLFSNVGTGDAHSTAMLSGVVNIIFKLIYASVTNKKPRSNIDINSNTDFKNEVFLISVYSKLSISILAIGVCFIETIFRKKRTT